MNVPAELLSALLQNQLGLWIAGGKREKRHCNELSELINTA